MKLVFASVAFLATALGIEVTSNPAVAATTVVVHHAPLVRVSETNRHPAAIKIVERNQPAPVINISERVVHPAPVLDLHESVQKIEPGVVVDPVDPFYSSETIDLWSQPPVSSPMVVVREPAPVEQLAWQGSETLVPSQGWVHTILPVNQSGNKLALTLKGTAQIQSAEVKFADGETEQVNLQQQTYGTGVYPILDFGGIRAVKTIELLARSDSPQTNLTLSLRT